MRGMGCILNEFEGLNSQLSPWMVRCWRAGNRRFIDPRLMVMFDFEHGVGIGWEGDWVSGERRWDDCEDDARWDGNAEIQLDRLPALM
jgi:hypothetical protein